MDRDTQQGPGDADRRAGIAAVIIGRNEGARLVACLASVAPQVGRMVYVDSGSTDDSVAQARAAGADVVELDLSTRFTAARARNAGFAVLEARHAPDLVQFIDGDCVLDPDWIGTAAAHLARDNRLAVVCGRRRERFAQASVYNRLCDREWDTPVGPARACGGDALVRASAFRAVGGFNPALIAGEEPELCLRLRRKGWLVERLAAEMTLHDAAMTRFRQWWQRSRRAGHAFAEGAALHGGPPERHFLQETVRAIVWGAILPVAIAGAALWWTPAALLLAIWPLQVLRLALRAGGRREDWEQAFFMVLGKFAEAQGVIEYWLRRLAGKDRGLIEYK